MTVLDQYAITNSSLLISLFALAGWMVFYGNQRLERDVQFWTKVETSTFLKLLLGLLKTFTPLALVSMIIARYAGVSLDGRDGCQDFGWVYILGWSLSAALLTAVFAGGCLVVSQQVDFGLFEVTCLYKCIIHEYFDAYVYTLSEMQKLCEK